MGRFRVGTRLANFHRYGFATDLTGNHRSSVAIGLPAYRYGVVLTEQKAEYLSSYGPLAVTLSVYG